MNCKQQCFRCHGFYGDGDIASQKRSLHHALTRNPNVDKFDLPIILPEIRKLIILIFRLYKLFTTNIVKNIRHPFVSSVLSVVSLDI